MSEPAGAGPRALLQVAFASRATTVAQCLLRSTDTTPVELVYGLWVLPTDDGVVLVDTGFDEDVAVRRGIAYHRTPLEALDGVGVAPADVTDVVLTHLHFDHAGRLDDFPAARVHVQRADVEFYTGPAMRFPLCASSTEKADLAALERVRADGRLHLLDGSARVRPGIDLHLVGGHTPGSQVVQVTVGERSVVLASDVAHVYENLERAVPFPVLHDLPGCCEAFETVERLAASGAQVVPGHDGRVMERYPTAGVPFAVCLL